MAVYWGVLIAGGCLASQSILQGKNRAGRNTIYKYVRASARGGLQWMSADLMILENYLLGCLKPSCL